MKTATRVVLLLVVLLTAAGCTKVINGAGQPAPGLTPQPVTGKDVKAVLVDSGQLDKLFDQQFRAGDVQSGGVEVLHTYTADRTDCLRVVTSMTSGSYRGADVLGVATQTWNDASRSSDTPALIEAEVGVVALKSAAEADELFEQFGQEWSDCSGTTVEFLSYQFPIDDVQVADSVVSARTDWGLPVVRAIGVRVNCLVEVELTYFTRSKQESLTDTRAVDLAHAMMDKVTDLS